MEATCVYEHWRPDTNVCFYVGKGPLRRSRDMGVSAGCRTAAHGAVQQEPKAKGLSVEVRIVAVGLDEIESLRFEMDRISLYGRADLGTGTLVNRTNGGSGTSGMRHTDASRAKLSAHFNPLGKPPRNTRLEPRTEYQAKLAAKRRRDQLSAKRQTRWIKPC